MQQQVLVARGPWMSWMAQFYLESLPLSGLVMVDPLPFNDGDACLLFEHMFKRHNGHVDALSREYILYQDYLNHWDHWMLKLEPGVIPMMVLHSQADARWRRHANATAARHSSDCRSVPVVDIDATNHGEYMQTICSWIEEEVL